MQYQCYHGTKSRFESFSPDFLGKGNDQFGSGYYFTTSKAVASGYASPSGFIINAIVNLNKPIVIDQSSGKSTKDLTVLQVRKLILNANNLDNYINDNYDVSYESRNSILKQIFEIYEPTGEIIRTLNTISSDIYGNDRGGIENFNENVRKITGYDGIIVHHANSMFVGEQNFVIAWFLDQIDITNVEEYNSITEAFDIKEIIPNKNAMSVISNIRMGGKHKGNKDIFTELPIDGDLALVDFPLSLLRDETIEWLRDSTDPARVDEYSKLNITTPVYINKNSRGRWIVSDGGHRITAAVNRGDITIPALIPVKYIENNSITEAFNQFLDSFKQYDSNLIESIKHGFNLCFDEN